MTFRLAIYSAWGSTNAALLRRQRLPGTYPTAGDAAAAGVVHLKANAQAVGFEVEAPGLEAANDAAMTARTIYRAQAARHKRQKRTEVQHDA